jgi:hypothetical protein
MRTGSEPSAWMTTACRTSLRFRESLLFLRLFFAKIGLFYKHKIMIQKFQGYIAASAPDFGQASMIEMSLSIFLFLGMI